ncbi:hypothetical protein EDC45_0566 [Mesocricetibacter intestinalis]|uniref:AsmA-like C-terminal domain-containing protein n=2 Tax=Mesocricetibacter intestinalis TaxID=1521930 RepID=A0A4R6VGF5_9PAST|nr:hypothetical protein EDC45_0566 [Mesocricetibacter intestinalis]
MGKKIGIGLVGAAVFVLFLFFLQTGKIEERLKSVFAEQGLEVRELHFNLLPSPVFIAEEVKYLFPAGSDAKGGKASFARFEIKFDFLSLLGARPRINAVQLQEGEIYLSFRTYPDFHAINLLLKPTALYAEDLPMLAYWLKTGLREPRTAPLSFTFLLSAKNAGLERLNLSGNMGLITAGIEAEELKVEITSPRATYAANKSFYAEIEQGYLHRTDGGDYELKAQKLKINRWGVAGVEATLALPNELRNSYALNFGATECGRCRLKAEIRESAPAHYNFSLNAQSFPLQPLLEVMRLPAPVSGRSDISAEGIIERGRPSAGRMHLSVSDGRLDGINLLRMVRDYLPLHYNESGFNTENTQTAFQHLSSALSWQGSSVAVEYLLLLTDKIRVEGNGNMSLTDMQCEAKIQIGINKKEYSALALPVRFFGDCGSPQYKLELNKSFREQVKKLIKEKLR